MTQPGNPGDQRIGHDERQQASDALGEHFAKGRLNMHEFEQRSAQAASARTAGELTALFHDLPEPKPVFVPLQPLQVPIAAPPHQMHPTGMPSDKSKVVSGILQIFLPFGIGRFYTGHIGIGLAQLMLSFCGVGVLWSFIDGIVILTTDSTDAHGRLLRS